MTRKQFVYSTLAAGIVFTVAAATPKLYHESSPSTSVVSITEANPVVGELDLIHGRQWNYMQGVSRNGDVLDIVYEGFKIVQQGGARGQDNPPVNEYGVYLMTIGNFSISAQLKNIRGEAGLTLYANPPIIFDEQRYDSKEVRVTIKNDTFWVGINYGNSIGWKISRMYNFNQLEVNTVEIIRQIHELTFIVNGQTVGAIDEKGVFNSGKVWFGLDAVNPGDSFSLSGLKAQALDAKSSVNAVDSSQLKINTTDSMGLNTLAEQKRPGFKIGAAMSLAPSVSDPKYNQLAFGGNFGLMSIENALKMQFVQPQPNVYSFQEGDALVDLAARHNMQVHGHAIVFGEANPKWVQDIAKNKPNRIKRIMLDRIARLVGHYKGRVASWDVVNEPLEDDDFFVTGSHELRHNIWYNSIGPDYLSQALIATHQADPNAELFINDYGMEGSGPRWDAMIKLATNLVEQGVPLTGIGFEAHVDTISRDKIDFTLLPQHFRQLAQLGLKARISEMDVGSSAGKDLQSQQFTDGLRTCINAPNCSSFTVWGVSDIYGAGNEITDRDKLRVYGGRLWDKKYKPIKAVGEMQKLLTN